MERLQGAFGIVYLGWTVYAINTTTGERRVADSVDVSPVQNLLVFHEDNTTGVIEVDIVDDLQPELAEMFAVELVIVIIQGDSDDGARLGNFSTSFFTVPESDDPYGLFRVSAGSKAVEVAEDLPQGQPELGTANIGVERNFGDLRDVQVID